MSWTYGGWGGAFGGSISEGFSMVFPALMAVDRWSAIAYDDDDEVTTGSLINNKGMTSWTCRPTATPSRACGGGS